jgi:hypothetical protein
MSRLFFYICIMKILIIILGAFWFFTSCKSQISDGPSISFTQEFAWPDSIKEDSVVSIGISAQGLDSKLTSLEIMVDNESDFDTTFTPQNSFNMIWKTSFLERSGSHDIKIKVTDDNDLIAQTNRLLLVKALDEPIIEFDSNYVHTDTLTTQGENLQFSIICKKGERPLDSLYVLYNKVVIYSYPNPVYKTFNDTLQVVPFMFLADKKGDFSLQFKLIDSAKKTAFATKKIKVE